MNTSRTSEQENRDVIEKHGKTMVALRKKTKTPCGSAPTHKKQLNIGLTKEPLPKAASAQAAAQAVKKCANCFGRGHTVDDCPCPVKEANSTQSSAAAPAPADPAQPPPQSPAQSSAQAAVDQADIAQPPHSPAQSSAEAAVDQADSAAG